uniref:Uncharacterized protein n=1 Tax=Oryza punctata TaxID=4537 RepID=A0A0E0KRP7_ORYPU
MRPWVGGLTVAMIVVAVCCCCCFSGVSVAEPTTFGDNFEITGAEDHVKTSADGQTCYLYLDNKRLVSESDLAAALLRTS